MNIDFESTSFSFYSYRMESTGGSLICYLAISNSQIEIHIVADRNPSLPNRLGICFDLMSYYSIREFPWNGFLMEQVLLLAH